MAVMRREERQGDWVGKKGEETGDRLL